MNHNHNSIKKVTGWLCFLLSIGLFMVQIGYLFIQSKYEVQYTDNRLFYLFNILIVIFLGLGLYLLLSISKKWRILGIVVIDFLIILNGILLTIHNDNLKVNEVVSLSPDLKHVFVIKENAETGEAIYYRTYLGIFARPKETLPYHSTSDFKVKWLADDVAVATYNDLNERIHQYVGTYGDRGGGYSYYYVGASIHGNWDGKNTQVVCNTEGITIKHEEKQEIYDWKNVVQFGTLAVVLVENNQARWTIALDDNFKYEPNSSNPSSGKIILYKATMKDNNPITLEARR